jgi:hypothetical protein
VCPAQFGWVNWTRPVLGGVSGGRGGNGFLRRAEPTNVCERGFRIAVGVMTVGGDGWRGAEAVLVFSELMRNGISSGGLISIIGRVRCIRALE